MATGLRGLAAAIGWFAVALQYWLVITGDIGPDPVNRTINFFSYFTILTNIVAAVAMTASVLAPGSFFKPPVGSHRHRHLHDRRLHHLPSDPARPLESPGLELGRRHEPALRHAGALRIDWLLFVPKATVPWRTALLALVYPLIYMGWTLWHSSWSGFYPYPFVDISQIGLEKSADQRRA